MDIEERRIDENDNDSKEILDIQKIWKLRVESSSKKKVSLIFNLFEVSKQAEMLDNLTFYKLKVDDFNFIEDMIKDTIRSRRGVVTYTWMKTAKSKAEYFDLLTQLEKHNIEENMAHFKKTKESRGLTKRLRAPHIRTLIV